MGGGLSSLVDGGGGGSKVLDGGGSKYSTGAGAGAGAGMGANYSMNGGTGPSAYGSYPVSYTTYVCSSQYFLAHCCIFPSVFPLLLTPHSIFFVSAESPLCTEEMICT